MNDKPPVKQIEEWLEIRHYQAADGRRMKSTRSRKTQEILFSGFAEIVENVPTPGGARKVGRTIEFPIGIFKTPEEAGLGWADARDTAITEHNVKASGLVLPAGARK